MVNIPLNLQVCLGFHGISGFSTLSHWVKTLRAPGAKTKTLQCLPEFCEILWANCRLEFIFSSWWLQFVNIWRFHMGTLGFHMGKVRKVQAMVVATQPIWKILISQIWSFPQVMVKIKDIWNHHLLSPPVENAPSTRVHSSWTTSTKVHMIWL